MAYFWGIFFVNMGGGGGQNYFHSTAPQPPPLWESFGGSCGGRMEEGRVREPSGAGKEARQKPPVCLHPLRRGCPYYLNKEWTNHRIAKSGRFKNFVGEPVFNLNSPAFSRENLRIQEKNGFSKPCRPWRTSVMWQWVRFLLINSAKTWCIAKKGLFISCTRGGL